MRLFFRLPTSGAVVEHGGMEDFFQLLNLFIGEALFFPADGAWAFVAAGDVWV